MSLRRRLVLLALTLVALAALALPVTLALLFGLQHHRVPGDIGRGSSIVLVLLPVYLVWLPVITVGLIWVFDRLGFHYGAGRRAAERRLLSPRQTRRLRAGLRFLAARPSFGRGPGSKRTGRPQGDQPADRRGIVEPPPGWGQPGARDKQRKR